MQILRALFLQKTLNFFVISQKLVSLHTELRLTSKNIQEL